MTDEKNLERLTILFKNLYNILYMCNDQNHKRYIEGLIAILLDETCSIKERFDEVRNGYRSINGGLGTFGDYFPYHHNKAIQKQFDIKFSYIKDEIWNLLDCNLSFLPSVDEGYPPDHPYWNIPNLK